MYNRPEPKMFKEFSFLLLPQHLITWFPLHSVSKDFDGLSTICLFWVPILVTYLLLLRSRQPFTQTNLGAKFASLILTLRHSKRSLTDIYFVFKATRKTMHLGIKEYNILNNGSTTIT